MKVLRVVYLIAVLGVAVAHLFLASSPWTAPAFTGMVTWFVPLLGAWVAVAVFDLILSLFDWMPLSFGIEAVIGIVSLAVLSSLTGGMVYVVFATLAPVLVGLKVVELFAQVDRHFHALEPKP